LLIKGAVILPFEMVVGISLDTNEGESDQELKFPVLPKVSSIYIHRGAHGMK
jgi:hypothetical protein